MSRSLGRTLPERVRGRFRFSPETLGKVLLLLTVDERGFPHTAMLSYREVAAPDGGHLRFCLRALTRTSANLRRSGKAALLLIEEGPAYYIKGTTRELKPSMQHFPDLALFELAIEEVLEDEEPTLPLTSGIRFAPPEDPDYLERGRRMAEALLSS